MKKRRRTYTEAEIRIYEAADEAQNDLIASIVVAWRPNLYRYEDWLDHALIMTYETTERCVTCGDLVIEAQDHDGTGFTIWLCRQCELVIAEADWRDNVRRPTVYEAVNELEYARDRRRKLLASGNGADAEKPLPVVRRSPARP